MRDSAQGLGRAIAKYRTLSGLTQAELAELMQAVGSDTGREQILHIEAGRRQLTADEMVTIAYVLRLPLFTLLSTAGYPLNGECKVALSPPPGVGMTPMPSWTPAAMRAASGGAAAHMRGDVEAVDAIAALMDSWRDYETRSGRPPGERAERTKRAALWKAYEKDPAAFIAQATGGAQT